MRVKIQFEDGYEGWRESRGWTELYIILSGMLAPASHREYRGRMEWETA